MGSDLIADVMAASVKAPQQTVDKSKKNLLAAGTDLFKKVVKSLEPVQPSNKAAESVNGDMVLDVMQAADSGTSDSVGEANSAVATAKPFKKTIFDRLEESVLTSLFTTMVPSEDGGIYGKGTAGEVWRGMHVEQMAKAAADANVLDLTKSTSQPSKQNPVLTQGDNQWPYFTKRGITPYSS